MDFNYFFMACVNLLSMIFPHMTFHCKLVLIQMSRNKFYKIWVLGQLIQTKTPTNASYYKLNKVHYFIYYKNLVPSISISLLIWIHFRQKSMRLCIFNDNNIVLSKYQPIEIIISCNVHSTLKTNFSNYAWMKIFRT